MMTDRLHRLRPGSMQVGHWQTQTGWCVASGHGTSAHGMLLIIQIELVGRPPALASAEVSKAEAGWLAVSGHGTRPTAHCKTFCRSLMTDGLASPKSRPIGHLRTICGMVAQVLWHISMRDMKQYVDGCQHMSKFHSKVLSEQCRVRNQRFNQSSFHSTLCGTHKMW